MLKDSVIKQIQMLVQQGHLSQRKIAKLLGVSRGTVQAVANGKRTEHDDKPSSKFWTIPTGQPQRCPLCGGRVRMPCLACQLYEFEQKTMSLTQDCR